MNNEQKQLLLIDLCARLPYGVKCYFEKDGGKSPVHVVTIGLFADVANRDDVICKPYLRPMSSMTEEEEKEWADLFIKPICELEQYTDEKEAQDMAPILYGRSHSLSTDWLNKKMFDYRGLIEKDLALEAPEEMYNTKTNKETTEL